MGYPNFSNYIFSTLYSQKTKTCAIHISGAHLRNFVVFYRVFVVIRITPLNIHTPHNPATAPRSAPSRIS